MSIHTTPHALAGQAATLKDGRTLRVEDWWDRAAGESWQVSQTPAAFLYALRVSSDGLPVDNDVVYGKDDAGFGHLVHVTEIASEGAAQ
ncbi:hypothetical protein ABZW11_26385 [Nonomuraea sp. NPDC004580]|uniref:hypothetical protein n=1 Tax=Nonomuraea sp. NPDC004580 TaxID=3154552 RepID=UPI0033A755A5